MSTYRLLLPVFFLSGLSALIYQVAWQRLLTVHYGVGSVSITLIVSVYMLGLGLGALLGGHIAERTRRGLVAYFVIELGIGLFGTASLPLLHWIGEQTAGSDYAVAFVSMFAFLLIPTALMGATLPLLVKVFSRLAVGFARSVSLLYFINTLGAAFGAFLTAYALISFWGLDVAIYCAAGVNLLLAVAVISLAGREPTGREATTETAREPIGTPGQALGAWAYPLVFVSGFLAIGYELVWLRLVGVLIKASPYAFATALSVYLLGIALGSFGVAQLVARRPQLRAAGLFFRLQFAAGASVVLLVAGFYHLTSVEGFAALVEHYFIQELHPAALTPGEIAGVFLWPVAFELLPAILIGAGFPLLASLARTRSGHEGITVGRVYFVNTMGNLLGGVVTGFLLSPYLGTELTLLLFSLVNIAMLLLSPWLAGQPRSAAPTVALVAAAVLAAWLVFPKRGELYDALWKGPAEDYARFFEEGVDGTVETFERGAGVANFINGLGHGGRPNRWFAWEATEAMAVAPRLKDVLIVGFGTGTITEFALLSDEVETVTLVELNRTLMKNLRKMAVFERILADERLRVVYDDGRRFMLATEKRYDLILMDPLRTTTAYSNNLYSLEFFTLASQRLEDCGVLFLWTDDTAGVPRTVASAFSHVTFHELYGGQGFMLASQCGLVRDPERAAQIAAKAPERVRAFLQRRTELPSPGLDREEILEAAASGTINRDWRPASEYYLGRTGWTAPEPETRRPPGRSRRRRQ